MKKSFLIVLLAFSPCVTTSLHARKAEKGERSEKGEKHDDDDNEKEEKAGKAEKEDDDDVEKSEAIEAKLAKLPAPAAAALKKAAGTATITAVDVEKEGDVTTYEIETSEKGQADREITVNAAGKILVEETTISMKDVPAAAQTAIKAGAHDAEIKRINKMVRGGAVSYEALYVSGKKRTEVEYNPDGSVHPE